MRKKNNVEKSFEIMNHIDHCGFSFSDEAKTSSVHDALFFDTSLQYTITQEVNTREFYRYVVDLTEEQAKRLKKLFALKDEYKIEKTEYTPSFVRQAQSLFIKSYIPAIAMYEIQDTGKFNTWNYGGGFYEDFGFKEIKL